MDCRATSWLAVAILLLSKLRGRQPVAIQVSLPHSPAPTVRTQSVGSTNGLPRRAISPPRSFGIIFSPLSQSKPRGRQPVAVQVPLPHSPAPTINPQSAAAASGLLRSARSFGFTSIEIARRTPVRRGNPSDPAAQSSPDCQDTVRWFYQWTAASLSGLAVSELFDAGIFIEIARASARGNPSDSAAQSSLTVAPRRSRGGGQIMPIETGARIC